MRLRLKLDSNINQVFQAILLALLTTTASQAQQGTVNALDLYQPQAEVTAGFAAIDRGDSLTIYSVLNFKESTDNELWVNYSWPLSGSQVFDSIPVDPAEGKYLLQWTFQKTQVPPVITVALDWKSRRWIFTEHFPMDAFHESGGISLWNQDQPLISNWINLGDSVELEASGAHTTSAYYYSHPFDPARPPMTVQPGISDSSLSIDSLLALNANAYFRPTQTGLYFFQKDTATTDGTSMVVTDEYFPQPRKISDLSEPLVYITTRKEYENLQNDLNSKQAFDKFWLSTVGSPDKARAAIRNYYQNIETANHLFTSYKEGWKTDRGMIYSVLGPPLSVTKELDGETWVYQDRSGEPLQFVFKKIRNIFSNSHYELYRDTAFERSWFLAVDRWRKGR